MTATENGAGSNSSNRSPFTAIDESEPAEPSLTNELPPRTVGRPLLPLTATLPTSGTKNRCFEALPCDFSRGRPPRFFCKETVPTALVSPHTVQITVQPPSTFGRRQMVEDGSNSRQQPYINCSVYGQRSVTGRDDSFSGKSSINNQSSPLSHINNASSFAAFAPDPWYDGRGATGTGSPRSRPYSSVAYSDERLDQLELRMRQLEHRLGDANGSGQATPTPGTPALSNSMRELNGGRRDYDDKIKRLQEQLEYDLGQKPFDQGRLRAPTTGRSPSLTRGEPFDPCWFVKPSCSLGDLVPRSPAPNEPRPPNVASPGNYSQSFSLDALEPAPDQYVPMQRYRLLKAKSKKMLADKSDAYRREKQEKESLLVQIQLQNKELSELRKKVYGKNASEQQGSERLQQKYKDLLKNLRNSSFAAACILGICKDVAEKKCPDYDQILGLKVADSVSSTLPLRLPPNDDTASSDVGLEQAQKLALACSQNLTEVQRLIVDYYTNELVDSIDCKLQ